MVSSSLNRVSLFHCFWVRLRLNIEKNKVTRLDWCAHTKKKIDGHMDFCWFDSIFSSSYTWLMLKNPTIDYWILHKYIMWHKVVFLNWSRLPFSLKIFILFHSTHPHKFWTVNCLNEWFMRSNKLIIQLFLFLFLFFSLSLSFPHWWQQIFEWIFYADLI